LLHGLLLACHFNETGIAQPDRSKDTVFRGSELRTRLGGTQVDLGDFGDYLHFNADLDEGVTIRLSLLLMGQYVSWVDDSLLYISSHQ